MIIVMEQGAPQEYIDEVIKQVRALGYEPHPIFGVERTVVAAVGDERGKARLESLVSLPGVADVIPILRPFKLSGREFKQEDTIIQVGDIAIGGKQIALMAGPCAVESEEQIMETARAVKEAGATILRGGAFKPRTSPYSFRGLAEEGLKLLAQAREETGLPIVTEVLGAQDVELVARYADILQLGARNMQNYALLDEVGEIRKPVLLKRGMMNTVTELLMSAEYILSKGNYQVILCERGIRTFETETRNTFDVNAIVLINKLSHLPIIADPSHGTGEWRMVSPVSKAAVAAGADGLLIEVHPHPEEALSDGRQSLLPQKFAQLAEELKPIAEAVGRSL